MNIQHSIEGDYLVIKIPMAFNQLPNTQQISDPLKHFKQNTRDFLTGVISRYGTNVEISKKDKFVQDLAYRYRINLGSLIKSLEERGLAIVDQSQLFPYHIKSFMLTI